MTIFSWNFFIFQLIIFLMRSTHSSSSNFSQTGPSNTGHLPYKRGSDALTWYINIALAFSNLNICYIYNLFHIPEMDNNIKILVVIKQRPIVNKIFLLWNYWDDAASESQKIWCGIMSPRSQNVLYLKRSSCSCSPPPGGPPPVTRQSPRPQQLELSRQT